MPKSDSTKHEEGKVFADTNLSKEWHRACAACGLGHIIEVEGKPYDPRYTGLTIHDLRRSAVRNLVNAGVPERVAMRISGHKTRAVFDRYCIVSTDDVTAAMQRVEIANGAKLGKKPSARGKRKAASS
jgi:integrase